MLEVHRTHQAKILNHSQVEESLDRHEWSASKLWNVLRLRLRAREIYSHDVANYHSREVWDETGNIPNHGDLKDELKTQTHPKYKGLHSQSSQRVLEELAEAFNSWKRKRKSDSLANPSGYRKKTTTTLKAAVSTKNTRTARGFGRQHVPTENDRLDCALPPGVGFAQ